MRGTLLILVLVAVIAVVIWTQWPPSDTPEALRSDTAEPAGGDPVATVDARTAGAGAEPAADATRTIDPGVASPGNLEQSAESDAADAGTLQTGETGPGSVASAAQPEDAGATGSTPPLRITAAGPADHSVTPEAVLSPAPEGMIERAPIDAPVEDAAGKTDVLAVAGRVMERAKTAIQERFPTEPEGDGDTGLRVEEGDTGSAMQTAHADAAALPDGAGTAGTDATEAEAKQYVETLTATTPQTIPVDKAAHFATREHVLSLIPEDTIESVPVADLAKDDTLGPETPITVVREVEQLETAVPEQLIAEAGGDLDAKLRVRVTYDDEEGGVEQGATEKAGEQDTVKEIPIREVLERIRSEPEKPISVVRTVRYFEVMTLRELLDTEQGTDMLLNVVTQPYRIETATLADLLQRQKIENPGTIFYLHTVQPTDEQGIWGIVHSGLIDNFARGVAVERGEATETYQVRIPKDADERLHDQSSSFLGKLIDRKTKESFVYNYREDRMGRNPDRIHPGQEIVIINFEPEELVSIYRHFASG